MRRAAQLQQEASDFINETGWENTDQRSRSTTRQSLLVRHMASRPRSQSRQVTHVNQMQRKTIRVLASISLLESTFCVAIRPVAVSISPFSSPSSMYSLVLSFSRGISSTVVFAALIVQMLRQSGKFASLVVVKSMAPQTWSK